MCTIRTANDSPKFAFLTLQGDYDFRTSPASSSSITFTCVMGQSVEIKLLFTWSRDYRRLRAGERIARQEFLPCCMHPMTINYLHRITLRYSKSTFIM